jgi:hypothetical protein
VVDITYIFFTGGFRCSRTYCISECAHFNYGREGSCEKDRAVPTTKITDEHANCDTSLNLEVGMK